MKNAAPALSLLALLGALAAGCRNPCEEAAHDIAKAYDDCSIAREESAVDPEPEECTEELGKHATCVAACTTDASCDALKGAVSEDIARYEKCLGGC